MSNEVPTIPFDQYTRPFRDRVDTGAHRSSSQAGLASMLPYPPDQVTNAIVELDVEEAAQISDHASGLARTADRLAAAYAAHVVILSKRASVHDWWQQEAAAREELRDALAEYEEARA